MIRASAIDPTTKTSFGMIVRLTKIQPSPVQNNTISKTLSKGLADCRCRLIVLVPYSGSLSVYTLFAFEYGSSSMLK